MEPKKPEDHLTPEERVFGVGYKLDADGMPVEAGIGSPSQPKAFPTTRPAQGEQDQKKDQLIFLHRMVAASGDMEMTRLFGEFLQWLKTKDQTTKADSDAKEN
jgi:hypothetical protein